MDKEAIFDRYQEGLRHKIPVHMHGGVHRYIMHGIQPGDFLLNLLQGNGRQAISIADGKNKAAFPEWLVFIADAIPPECHGTPEKVSDWMNHKGLDGLE